MHASTTYTAAEGAGYERNMGRWSRQLALPFLDFAGTGARERVLDVGCGTGALSAQLLAREASCEVHAVDLTPAYVAHAHRHLPPPRPALAVGDACALPYRDGVFDRVLSLLVLHFVPRPAQAVAQMVRVARPGATVAAAVWDARGGFVAGRMFFDTAAALDPGAAQQRARNFTRPMTRPGELATAWREAGLVEVEQTQVGIRMAFADFEDYWSPYLGKDGPGAAYVSGLDAAARARLEAAMRAAYLDGEADGPRAYAALAWAVKGRVPPA
ncbi:class I SAM-dependent methyltransferase [Pseudoxanthomonas winnipegensis]|uniref:Class I SAM-dependent methyltransferase n=1 Tax=Pseudoxanthomonas winnipegensis TaxID=2480810 RepID=A0A4Q8L991_9GAMM|nr:class I SAM-dependent methyltransferase [Pseudoxanthomonas winnipegensis]RZZ81553.1 class I SAM-dependent methyltransferase [Pseudoxanthomonas winnipegensis]TAA24667.1 class I SAM-dependent methyltransferase [Pseudoxanthomonas winnipegensis]TAA39919.1 class I SAM-dependent methyltransferase [Pseudoxanthomonas winnipegensis]